MRIGNFTALVPEGREYGTGHVELAHGQVYTLKLVNADHTRRCDAQVTIDGKDMGSYRIDAGGSIALERSSHDNGRFTFFTADSQEGTAAGAAKVAVAERGLVQVRFRPERRPVPPQAVLLNTPCSFGGPQLRSRGYGPGGQHTNSCKGLAAGVTGLTGYSDQSFTSVRNLDYDPAGEVVITLRLVAGAAVRELTPAQPLANPVPAPVE